MKKALITTLAILGSSSVAMARPVTYSASAEASWNYSSTPTMVVRDHRTVEPRPAQRSWYQSSRFGRDTSWNMGRDRETNQPRALTLGENLSFFDTEFRKDVIVGSQVGGFNTLQIESEGGRTYVQKIGIEFSNGQVQMIPLNLTLAGNQAMRFDLDGNNRAISRIFVYRADGEEAHHLNLRHRGAFTVSAL